MLDDLTAAEICLIVQIFKHMPSLAVVARNDGMHILMALPEAESLMMKLKEVVAEREDIKQFIDHHYGNDDNG